MGAFQEGDAEADCSQTSKLIYPRALILLARIKATAGLVIRGAWRPAEHSSALNRIPMGDVEHANSRCRAVRAFDDVPAEL